MVDLEQIIVAVRQLEVYGEGAVLELFRIHDDTHVIQHGLCVHALRGGADAEPRRLRVLPGAVSQLKGRRVLSLIGMQQCLVLLFLRCGTYPIYEKGASSAPYVRRDNAQTAYI